MAQLPRSPIQRQSILNRTMLRNAAGGRTAIVASQPRPLAPPGTPSPPPPTVAGITAAGKLISDNVGQTIPAGTTTNVTCLKWDSVIGDGDATPLAGDVTVDTTNGYIIINTAGTYLVGGQVIWQDDGTAAADGFRHMLIRRHQTGSGTWIAEDRRLGVGAGDRTIQTCSGLVNCYRGDHLLMDVTQGTAGDLVVGGFNEMNLWCFGIGVWGGA